MGPPADGLGAVVESYAVRAGAQLDDAQDGGAVSALLIGLLAAGEIDGALVSKPSDDPDEQWKGIATIATTAEEITSRPAASTTRPWPWPSSTSPRYDLPAQAAHRRGRHARARSRGSGPCRPGAGRPGPTGSTRSC